MSKDLINKILEEIGLESLFTESDDTQGDRRPSDSHQNSTFYTNRSR